jgi:hypothetical protein
VSVRPPDQSVAFSRVTSRPSLATYYESAVLSTSCQCTVSDRLEDDIGERIKSSFEVMCSNFFSSIVLEKVSIFDLRGRIPHTGNEQTTNSIDRNLLIQAHTSSSIDLRASDRAIRKIISRAQRDRSIRISAYV